MAIELHPLISAQDADNTGMLLDAVRELDAHNKSSKAQNRRVQELAGALIQDFSDPIKREILARDNRVYSLIQQRGYISHWGGFNRWFGTSKTEKALADVIAIWQPMRCQAIREDYATVCDSLVLVTNEYAVNSLVVTLNELFDRSSENYGAYERTLLHVIRERPSLRNNADFCEIVRKTLRDGMYNQELADFLSRPPQTAHSLNGNATPPAA